MKTLQRAGLGSALLVAFAFGYEVHRREWIPLPIRQYLLGLAEPDEDPHLGRATAIPNPSRPKPRPL